MEAQLEYGSAPRQKAALVLLSEVDSNSTIPFSSTRVSLYATEQVKASRRSVEITTTDSVDHMLLIGHLLIVPPLSLQ